MPVMIRSVCCCGVSPDGRGVAPVAARAARVMVTWAVVGSVAIVVPAPRMFCRCGGGVAFRQHQGRSVPKRPTEWIAHNQTSPLRCPVPLLPAGWPGSPCWPFGVRVRSPSQVRSAVVKLRCLRVGPGRRPRRRCPSGQMNAAERSPRSAIRPHVLDRRAAEVRRTSSPCSAARRAGGRYSDRPVGPRLSSRAAHARERPVRQLLGGRDQVGDQSWTREPRQVCRSSRPPELTGGEQDRAVAVEPCRVTLRVDL